MRPHIQFALILALSTSVSAATLTVRVQDANGKVINDAVVYAEPEGRSLPLAKKTAVMDQRNRMFVPHVLAIQTGTAVTFPNSDDVRHHVYSFSPAKTFQLPLYKGTPASPEVFDRAGVATLGCNIHDQMSASIVVVDTPFFAKTVNGVAELDGVDAGRYQLHVWVPDTRLRVEPRAITVGAANLSYSMVAGRANARP